MTFEIPYNFDMKLIDILKELDPKGETIDSIYIEPFREDYISAKYYYTRFSEGLDMSIARPDNRFIYEQHINYINRNFNNKLMLLLQNTSIISDELLEYYHSLGIRKFCVGTLEEAKHIKTKYSNSEIIGSITMKAEEDIFFEKDYKKYFDGFVLWFQFNRDIERIQKLPKWFKYILLVNCGCSINCDGTHHWFASQEEELGNYCTKFKTPHELKDTILIRPTDLSLFDNYIYSYKLQGRENFTKEIISDYILYSTNYNRYKYNTSPELYTKE